MSPLYKSYAFKNKDPIIDLLRTVMQLYANVEGIKFSKACAKISKASGVKPSTYYAWFGGSTISPRYCSVAATVAALGQPIGIGDRKLRTKPQAVKQRRAA